MKYRNCLLLALILRLILVIWGHIQDQILQVKYTDIDYNVFTDAARFVTQGKSPYLRPTYRYTPLLAWILTPNIFLNINFGKILFSFVDIVNGHIIYNSVLAQSDSKAALLSCCLWLFNPITFVVSTRGNAETLITLMVLITLVYHRKGKYFISGFFLGLAVHLKIYPIIYSVVLYCSISSTITLVESLKPTGGRLKFVFGFFLSVVSTTIFCYIMYGWPFLEETYLYHVTRQDVRHNFSPYFYFLYLNGGENSVLSLVAFLPQLFMVWILSWYFRSKEYLHLALFLLTYGFVTFNKVVTAQYFMWYISLLPLCVHNFEFPLKRTVFLVSIWFASIGIWLGSAYLLEFRGENVFLLVWLSSLMFFAVNIYVMCQCAKFKNVKVKKV